MGASRNFGAVKVIAPHKHDPLTTLFPYSPQNTRSSCDRILTLYRSISSIWVFRTKNHHALTGIKRSDYLKHFIHTPLLCSAAASLCLSTPAFAQTERSLAEIEVLFAGADIISGPEIVDCKLSGGTESTCFSITVRPVPATYAAGPWCPRTGSDSATEAGIWLQDGKVYDADGDFMGKLSVLYDDPKWQMVDPATGAINVTDSKEQCADAANPNVGAEYENFCVECLPEYLDDGTSVTYTIPLQPVAADQSTDIRRTGAGLAVNGIRLDGPAPVDAILGAYTIAPFDDCGGHINLFVGYHYHAVTDCLTEAESDGDHGSIIGLAMDGFAIFGTTLTDGKRPVDLDECFGHETADMGYHYHAGEAGGNQILGCLSAQTGCTSESDDAACDATARPRR